ncbi:MAG: GAF domain-containing sensor histidine kinase [Bryobacterales bacterium]|nr:GAF domain-containing sensor histidine kinase [Bryobacterales bacterium]
MEQVREHLDLLLLVRTGANGRFVRYLYTTELSPEEQKPVRSILLDSVLDSIQHYHPNETILEEIEYQARRLAKLQVDPALVHEALDFFDESLIQAVAERFPEQVFVARTIVNHYHLFVTNVINVAIYHLWRTDSKLLEEISSVELSELGEHDLCSRVAFLVKLWSGADAVAIHRLPRRASASASEAAAFSLNTNLASEVLPSAMEDGPQEPSEQEGWPAELAAALSFRATENDPRVMTRRWLGRYRSFWSFPIRVGMRQIGVLQLAFLRGYDWLASEKTVLLQVSERLGLALTRCELLAGLSSREIQVRQLASHLQQVEERERKRISRELHDEAGQSLLYLRLQLEMLEKSLIAGQDRLRSELRRSRLQVETIIVEIRRLISALSPTVLEQFGLVAAIRHLLKEFLRVSSAHVDLTIDLPDGTEISSGSSMVAYRFVQEALHNILSHSKADTVQVSITLADEQLVCEVADDGVGFRVRDVQRQSHSFGLKGISERVLLLGGEVEIASEPGEGARVTARIPLNETRSMPGLKSLAKLARGLGGRDEPNSPKTGHSGSHASGNEYSVASLSGWELVGGAAPEPANESEIARSKRSSGTETNREPGDQRTNQE